MVIQRISGKFLPQRAEDQASLPTSRRNKESLLLFVPFLLVEEDDL